MKTSKAGHIAPSIITVSENKYQSKFSRKKDLDGYSSAEILSQSKNTASAAQSPNLLTFKVPKNQFQGINPARLCSLAGRYDNPIPTRFLAPIHCFKIPAQASWQLDKGVNF